MAAIEYGGLIKEEVDSVDYNHTNSEESDAFKISIPKKEFESVLIKSEDVINFVNDELKSEECWEEVKEGSYCEMCGGRLLNPTDFFSPDSLKFSCNCQCQNDYDVMQSENTSDVKPFGFGSDLEKIAGKEKDFFNGTVSPTSCDKEFIVESVQLVEDKMPCETEEIDEIFSSGNYLNSNAASGFHEENEECSKNLTDVTTCKKNNQCKFCSKAFNHRCRLEKHETIHTSKKPFQCNVCSKSFRESGYLKIHEKIHTGEKPYQCKICSKPFLRNNDLKSHENIHTGKKPYQCEICSKLFNDSSNLRRHKKIHSFRCNVCCKSFIENSDLKTHEMIHSDEKQFECKICSKSFKDCNNLSRHKKIHSFRCNVCSKSFIENSDLKTHEMIHSDEKPFQCKMCQRSFIRNCYLKSHEKIHTVNKPFHCEICSIPFRSFCNLKNHEKIHASKKLVQCKICSKTFDQCMCGKFNRHEKGHTGKKPSVKSVLDQSAVAS